MEKVIIIGAGGHAKALIDCIEEENKYEISSIVDDDPKVTKIFNHSVSVRDEINFADRKCIVAIGNCQTRREIISHLNSEFFTSVHPRATVSKYSKIGIGSQIFAGVVINSGAKIGDHCIINTGAIIDHDCVVGDFVNISPNVSLAGGAKIGSSTNIGIGAVVIQTVSIGSNVIIGAGSVVISDIPDNCTALGTPAKIVKQHFV